MADEPSEAQDLASESGSNLDLLNNLLDGKSGGDDKDVSGPGDESVQEPPASEEEEIEQEIEGQDEPPVEEDEEEVDGQEGEDGEDEGVDDLEDEVNTRIPKLEPPLFRDLQKTHPELFKGKMGRELRQVIFREHQLSELFPSIAEAKDASERVEDAQEFEAAIIDGDAGAFVRAVGNANKQSLEKFMDNLLPALHENAREVYGKVTSRVLVNALTLAKRQGEAALKSGDTKRGNNLVNSVHQLANLIWPSQGGNIPEMPSEKKDPALEAKERELEEKERRILDNAYQTFNQNVRGVSIKLLRNRILKGIDPQNSLPDFIKDSIVDKTLREIGQALDDDPQHNVSMQRLWKKARMSGYPKELQAKLIGAYLGRASQLVGSVRGKYLKQALGKVSGKPAGGDLNRPPIRKPVGQGTTGGRQRTGSIPSAKDIDWSKTSVRDVFDGKITPKKRS
jgi:hypothetical protein